MSELARNVIARARQCTRAAAQYLLDHLSAETAAEIEAIANSQAEAEDQNAQVLSLLAASPPSFAGHGPPAASTTADPNAPPGETGGATDETEVAGDPEGPEEA